MVIFQANLQSLESEWTYSAPRAFLPVLGLFRSAFAFVGLFSLACAFLFLMKVSLAFLDLCWSSLFGLSLPHTFTRCMSLHFQAFPILLSAVPTAPKALNANLLGRWSCVRECNSSTKERYTSSSTDCNRRRHSISFFLEEGGPRGSLW